MLIRNTGYKQTMATEKLYQIIKTMFLTMNPHDFGVGIYICPDPDITI